MTTATTTIQVKTYPTPDGSWDGFRQVPGPCPAHGAAGHDFTAARTLSDLHVGNDCEINRCACGAAQIFEDGRYYTYEWDDPWKRGNLFGYWPARKDGRPAACGPIRPDGADAMAAVLLMEAGRP